MIRSDFLSLYTPYYPIEYKPRPSLPTRVWQAVAKFFTMVAVKIKQGIQFIGTALANCFCPNRPKPKLTLQDKLAPYQNMPIDDKAFLQKAVDNAREELKRKDASLREKLLQTLKVDAKELAQMMTDQEAFTKQMAQRKPPIRPEELPFQLATFNEGVKTLYNIPEVLTAAVRAFIFSRETIADWRCPNFLRYSHQDAQDLPLPTELGGKPYHQIRPIGCFSLLKRTKDFFWKKLDDQQREKIVDGFGSPLTHLELNKVGQRVAEDIGKIALPLSCIGWSDGLEKVMEDLH